MAKTIQTRSQARQWHETYDPLAPKAGDAAPDFRLPDHRGGYVTLSDYKGKSNVVLAFFPAAFTPV